MNVAAGCEDDLLAELPSLVSTLHAGGATAIQISHQVGTDGDCRLVVEVIRPRSTTDDEAWKYRWP